MIKVTVFKKKKKRKRLAFEGISSTHKTHPEVNFGAAIYKLSLFSLGKKSFITLENIVILGSLKSFNLHTSSRLRIQAVCKIY